MIIFDCLREFIDSYSDYPSQDNEGYIPDRGAFKSGFFACYRKLNPMFMKAQEHIAKLKSEKETWGNEFNAVIVLKEENEKLRKENQRLKDGITSLLCDAIDE